MNPFQTSGTFELRVAAAFVLVAAMFLVAAAVGRPSPAPSTDYGSPALLQLGHGPGGPSAAAK